MLFFTYLLTSAYSSCAFAFAVLVRLLFTAVFFSFRIWTLRKVSTEIHSFCCGVLGPTTSWQVDVHVSFMFCHCLFRSVSSSSSSCSIWNLLVSFNLYSSLVCASFRKLTLYFFRFTAVYIRFFFSFSFSMATSRWWSDAASAPLFTLTS